MNKFLVIRNRLALSLIMGLVSACAVVFYLKGEKKKIETKFFMTTVLTARKYISQGKTITPDMVEEVAIPIAYLQPTALQQLTDLKGESVKHFYKARIEFLKGEQLTKSKLWEDSVFQGLSWILQPMQVAVCLKLQPENAVAGLIQPGDWVSLFLTMDREEGWPDSKTKMILQRVQVVAVQDQIWDPVASTEKKLPGKNMPMDSILVTLALTPEDAAHAMLGADNGRIDLALLSPMATELPPVVSARLVELNNKR